MIVLKKATMREMLREHNNLNGFGFSLAEFLLAALVAFWLCAAYLSRGRVMWFVAWLGIAINSVTICVTVLVQIRRGERSKGLYDTYFGKGRETVRREHPKLMEHTVHIVLATAVPFLLALLVLVDR